MLRNLIIAFIIALGLNAAPISTPEFAPIIGTTVAKAKSCPKGQVYSANRDRCVYRNPKQKDFGNGKANPKTINVQVCITWFNLLNRDGGKPWWGLRLTSWPGTQYKPVYTSCRWQNVPVGYRVYNDPACFPGWRYATEPITVEGKTYTLTRWKRL